ncbi:MAG: hypothetical protein DRR42_10695 [Gammaproteobacteria bacterium]|nr:MAG: hypothetical protein DRR42_10695 [Gammaproteobacteria bacterium]
MGARMSLGRIRKATQLVGSILFLVANAYAQGADSQYNFRIEEKALGRALDAFVRLTNVQLLYPDELATTTGVSPVIGLYGVDEALEILLQGTGLSSGLTPSGVVVISYRKKINEENDMQRVKSKTALSGLVALLFGALDPSGTYAQPTEDTSSANRQLEETIVTASRRTEVVQRSSLDIQAFDGAALEKNGVVEMRDLMSLVPAFNVSARGSNVHLFVRGVGSNVVTSLDEGAIAVNLDQTYLSSASGVSGMFFDLERLELLKGPQGTLYGRNASAGAMNLVTRKPRLGEFGGYVSADVGNYEKKLLEGALNLPIGETLAFRAAFQVVDREGYYNDDSGDDVHESARLHAFWRPNDAVSLLVSGDYTHFGGEGEGYSLYPRVDSSDDYIGITDPRVHEAESINPNTRPVTEVSQDNETYGVQANLEWDLGPVVLNVIPAYRKTKMDFLTGGLGGKYTVDDTQPQTTVELRLSSDSEASSLFSWVVGGYYLDVDQNYLFSADFGPQQFNLLKGKQETKSYAGYGEVVVNATDQLRLIGGIRYTDETKDLDGTSLTISLRGTSVGASGGDLSTDKTTWKAGLEYDVAPDVMAFFTVATGFKAGGITFNREPDGTPENPIPNTFDAELLTSYTLGLKSRWLDDQLQVNITGFYWDYSDRQFIQVGPVNPAGSIGRNTINIPDAPELYGVEFDVEWLATAVDLFTINMGYLHAVNNEHIITGSPAASPATTGCAIGAGPVPLKTIDCSGFRLLKSPKWSGTVGYEHIFDIESGGRVLAGARVQFSSKYLTGENYLPQQQQKAYTNTSLDLTYEAPTGEWSVTAYAKNLEDEAAKVSNLAAPFTPGLSYDVLRSPRTYGVRAQLSF